MLILINSDLQEKQVLKMATPNLREPDTDIYSIVSIKLLMLCPHINTCCAQELYYFALEINLRGVSNCLTLPEAGI